MVVVVAMTCLWFNDGIQNSHIPLSHDQRSLLHQLALFKMAYKVWSFGVLLFWFCCAK